MLSLTSEPMKDKAAQSAQSLDVYLSKGMILIKKLHQQHNTNIKVKQTNKT